MITIERKKLERAIKAMLNSNSTSYEILNAAAAIKEALAQTSTQCEKQPAQEPDELTIAYMSGLYDGKKKRPWVSLTDEEIHDTEGYVETRETYRLCRAIEAKLKEKNFD